MNLSQAIIKKSLKHVDSDCVSFGVLDFSIGFAASPICAKILRFFFFLKISTTVTLLLI